MFEFTATHDGSSSIVSDPMAMFARMWTLWYKVPSHAEQKEILQSLGVGEEYDCGEFKVKRLS